MSSKLRAEDALRVGFAAGYHSLSESVCRQYQSTNQFSLLKPSDKRAAQLAALNPTSMAIMGAVPDHWSVCPHNTGSALQGA